MTSQLPARGPRSRSSRLITTVPFRNSMSPLSGRCTWLMR